MSNMQNLKDKDVGATLERLKEKLADDIKIYISWDKYKALPLLCPNWSDILQTALSGRHSQMT